MSSREAFLRSVIGKPYQIGARGSASFDCYGLADYASRCLFGRALPDRVSVALKTGWQRIEQPVEGSVALMGAGASSRHIGLFVECGILHAMDGQGVVHDDLVSLGFRGYRNPRFYGPA